MNERQILRSLEKEADEGAFPLKFIVEGGLVRELQIQ